MFKRVVMGAGLSLAMLGGVAGATHTGGTASAHPAARAAAAGVSAADAAIQTADAVDTTPCTVDAAGNEDGNCQDSQNASGGPDVAGATEAAGASEAATPETDTVQAGDQVGGN